MELFLCAYGNGCVSVADNGIFPFFVWLLSLNLKILILFVNFYLYLFIRHFII